MKLLVVVLACVLIYFQVSIGYAANRTATLLVPGMDCGACPITVRKALSRVDGVGDVSVSFEKRQATVRFDDAKTTVDALTQATANAGYPSTLVEGVSK